MSFVQPYVRHMIVCDDVQPDPTNPNKTNVFGMVSYLDPQPGEKYPLIRPRLCVYLELSNGRGPARVDVVLTDTASGRLVFGSAPHTIQFGGNPLDIRALTFRILNGVVPRRGVYLVEFRCGGTAVYSQPLVAR